MPHNQFLLLGIACGVIFDKLLKNSLLAINLLGHFLFGFIVNCNYMEFTLNIRDHIVTWLDYNSTCCLIIYFPVVLALNYYSYVYLQLHPVFS